MMMTTMTMKMTMPMTVTMTATMTMTMTITMTMMIMVNYVQRHSLNLISFISKENKDRTKIMKENCALLLM